MTLAWRNIVHDRMRALIVLASIGFAILLLFIQVGFYTSCRLSATLVHEMLDFDLVLTSPNYSIVGETPEIPRRRLQQVRALPEVREAVGVRIASTPWRTPYDGDLHSVLLIGVDPAERPFVPAELNDRLKLLTVPDTLLNDEIAHDRMGAVGTGESVEVAGRDVTVVDTYAWGVGFVALGAAVTSDRTLATLRGESVPRSLSMVLLRLRDGVDGNEAAASVVGALPGDIRLWTRAELLKHERAYWMRTKPMGLMFTSGVVIALIVGIVILYQVLAADVTKRLGEYATLKAIGYAPREVQAVVVQQGLLFGLVGFVPAAALATLLYGVLRQATDLPIFMTPHKIFGVLVLSLAMCALSGGLVMRRVTTADPADLF